MRFVLACCAVALVACGRAPTTSGNKSLSPPSKPTPIAADQQAAGGRAEAVSSWSYPERSDELRGQKVRYAVLLSHNAVKVNDGPYDTIMKLIVRKSEARTNIIFQTFGSDAAFLCNMYAGQRISARFDQGKIGTYRCITSADGDATILYIDDDAGFLKQLRGSKKLIVELPFLAGGRAQFMFHTEKLVWN